MTQLIFIIRPSIATPQCLISQRRQAGNITEAPPVADEARRCWRKTRSIAPAPRAIGDYVLRVARASCFASRSLASLNWLVKHCGAAIESLIIKTGWFAIFTLPKSRNRVCFRQFKSTKVLYRLLPTSDSRKGCPYEWLVKQAFSKISCRLRGIGASSRRTLRDREQQIC